MSHLKPTMGWVHVKTSRAWGSLKLTLMTHLPKKHQKCDLFLLFPMVVQTCWPRCLMWDKLSWCPEKRLLCKDSRIHFLTLSEYWKPNNSLKQRDTDSCEYLTDWEEQKNFVYTFWILEKRNESLWPTATNILMAQSCKNYKDKYFIFHFTQNCLHCKYSPHCYIFVCICIFVNFSRSINPCSKFGDLRIF